MSHERKSEEQSLLVKGVVDPRYNGGMPGLGQTWILQFAFETWRDKDNSLHQSRLIVTRQVTREELEWHFERIKDYKILAARVIFTSLDSAEMLELLGEAADDELEQRAIELQKSITREHECFGTLTFDRKRDEYEATVTWNASPITLILYAIEDVDVEAAIRTAEQLWEHQKQWNESVEAFAVEKLMNLKNSTWLEDDEETVTPEIFKSRISLRTITVSPKGFLGFWYNDGDLFGFHSIHVEGSLQHGLIDARIEG
jgi:hypothetical protein